MIQTAQNITPPTLWFWAYVLHEQGTEQVEFDSLKKAIDWCETFTGMVAYKIVDQSTNEAVVDNTDFDNKRKAFNDTWAKNFLDRLDDHIKGDE